MPSCSYCRSPITGSGYRGRERGDIPAAAYCCFGCLNLGESQIENAACWDDKSCTSHRKIDGVGLRLGLAVLIAGQSMIFGLALNLHDDVPLAARWIVQSL